MTQKREKNFKKREFPSDKKSSSVIVLIKAGTNQISDGLSKKTITPQVQLENDNSFSGAGW